MNTLSQLIASAGNNLETALLLCVLLLAFYVLYESVLPLFWTIPFYTQTHTQTGTHSISLCALVVVAVVVP